jgi:hypothetical protein
MNGKSSATALTEDSRETLRDPADLVMERTIWRKLDLYILPVVSMFYFLSFLVSTLLAFWRNDSERPIVQHDRIGPTLAMLASLDCKRT